MILSALSWRTTCERLRYEFGARHRSHEMRPSATLSRPGLRHSRRRHHQTRKSKSLRAKLSRERALKETIDATPEGLESQNPRYYILTPQDPKSQAFQVHDKDRPRQRRPVTVRRVAMMINDQETLFDETAQHQYNRMGTTPTCKYQATSQQWWC